MRLRMRENLQVVAIASAAGYHGGDAASHLQDLIDDLEPREEWDPSDPDSPPPPEMDADERQIAVMSLVGASGGGVSFQRVKVEAN